MAEEKYRCENCSHVCTADEMGADYAFDGEDEVWSNWICPGCGAYG